LFIERRGYYSKPSYLTLRSGEGVWGWRGRAVLNDFGEVWVKAAQKGCSLTEQVWRENHVVSEILDATVSEVSKLEGGTNMAGGGIR